MLNSTRCIISVCGLIAIAGTAMAQSKSQAVRVRTDASGTWLVPAKNAAPLPIPGGMDSILWTYPEPISIPESCGLSQASGHAWVGEHLNNERLQVFAFGGGGTPLNEFPGGQNNTNPAVAAACMNADLAVFADQAVDNGPLQIKAYRSTSITPLWTYDVAANFNAIGTHNLKISRDGSTVVMAVIDPSNNVPSVITLNGATGTFRSQWTGVSGGCSGIECTDDGSKAIICENSPPAAIGRLINTTNGTEITTFPGNGGGGWFNISGNGNVVVIGGFSLRAYVFDGVSYQIRINFNAAGSWFSWGSAVSRDGSTVAALTHVYTANYLNTDVRIWDVASATLLGTVSTVGSGGLQDSAVGGVLSDNGSRFAVASWGDQVGTHPEVRVFDRSLNLLDSIDTSGSPFSLDMTGDGQYILTGFKSVHANTLGNGGGVTLLQIPIGNACYANCDGSTAPPVLNSLDFGCFLTKFAAGDSYANCDNSTAPPALNSLDFGCFLTKFAAGCT